MAKTAEERIPIVLEMLFPTAYLETKIPGDPAGRTYAEWQSEVRMPQCFPPNTDGNLTPTDPLSILIGL